MNFFENIHETQITRTARQPRATTRNIPLYRRLFPIGRSQSDIARAAVLEVMG